HGEVLSCGRMAKIFELVFPQEVTLPTIARSLACLLLPYPRYSPAIWTRKAAGRSHGLETPAGIYHGDGRSGINAAERVPVDVKLHPLPPAQSAPPAERRRTHGLGEDWLQAGQAGSAGRGDDCQARHDSRLAPHTRGQEV